MKSLTLLLSVLSALSVQAEAQRFVSLRKGDTITLRAGEAAEMMTSESVSTSVIFHNSSGEFFLHRNFVWSEKLSTHPLAIAGPATVKCIPPNGIEESFTGFSTWRVSPGFTDPGKTLTLAPTTNAVTVHLEGSTNLVDWTKAASVTLTNVPTATFYRARLE
jgi:hypothetical protein